MTEAEVLAQIGTYANQISASMQYWTSVSFAVLVAAHLTRGQVTGVIIAVAIIFYVAFSWLMASMTLFQVEMISSAASLLAQMEQNGTLSLMGEAAIKGGPIATASTQVLIARRVVLFGIFVLTCAYPIYCHYTAKSSGE